MAVRSTAGGGQKKALRAFFLAPGGWGKDELAIILFLRTGDIDGRFSPILPHGDKSVVTLHSAVFFVRAVFIRAGVRALSAFSASN